jgi:hypothetical protein
MKVGEKKKGKDGNMWIIKQVKNSKCNCKNCIKIGSSWNFKTIEECILENNIIYNHVVIPTMQG